LASEGVNETEAYRLIKTTITMDNEDLDSVAASDDVLIRFYRDVSGVDTCDTDAFLKKVVLKIPRND
ncbi:unnamed protein product, partial [marine sediment metagenome]